MLRTPLTVPPFFDPQSVDVVWRVPYQQRANDAADWRGQHCIPASAEDAFRISLMLVDLQNTFCIPGFELYVGGRSGRGAVDDNRRVCEFIYRNLAALTEICPTMDTHQAHQIFHNIFLVDSDGGHPSPFTTITLDDIEQGLWRFNSALAPGLQLTEEEGQRYLTHYARELQSRGKYDLTIWPYHAMLGGIGHALVSAVEEAVFFHGLCRLSQADFQVKGRNPLTENYSVLQPEITTGPDGKTVGAKNLKFIQKLLNFDAVIIAGQAKSHCVAWTIEDLLNEIQATGQPLAEKIYLLEDCTSPVVIPEIVDYTDMANRAFEKFADAGMHLVKSTTPLNEWPGFKR